MSSLIRSPIDIYRITVASANTESKPPSSLMTNIENRNSLNLLLLCWLSTQKSEPSLEIRLSYFLCVNPLIVFLHP